MTRDRPYTGYSRASFRPIAHCRMEMHPAEPWPPRGWSYEGLSRHLYKAALTNAFLAGKSWEYGTDGDGRDQELAQLGPDGARLLRDAHKAIVALSDMTNADTLELDMRDERGKDSA